MYAVIATGGKQEKVEPGQVLNVELLPGDEGAEVNFSPILLVDNEDVMSTEDELSGVTVTARILGEVKGCLLYTSPSPRDKRQSRMPSSA